MTCDGGWPDSYPASEYVKIQIENGRLRAQVDRLGGSIIELTGELPVEHPAQQELDRLRRHEKIAWDHVAAFKTLADDSQEARQNAEDELAAARKTIKRMRSTIAKLEEELGLDQDL